jgi:hypothetical protein
MLPVAVSIAIILLVAVLRNYSKSLAAIFATMPINLPLSLWVIASASDGDEAELATYAEKLVIGLIPTIVFMIVAWLATRAGLSVFPAIIIGYVGWGVVFGLIVLVRGGL